MPAFRRLAYSIGANRVAWVIVGVRCCLNKFNVSTAPIYPAVRIGHVHLKVADLERAFGFYRDVLGFELMQRFGTQAAFDEAAASRRLRPAG